MHQKLSKVAILTGANGGLGRAIATNLAHEGYQVLSCVRRLDIEKTNNQSNDFYALDIRDAREVHNVVARMLDQYGRVDTLVNCAGTISHLSPLEKTTSEDIRDCFETNVFGPYYMIKEVIPIMKQQGTGVIVNIASKAAVIPVPYLAAYSASKASLVALTQALAKELEKERKDILCCSVCPSGMKTKMRAKVFGEADAQRQQDPRTVANLVTDILKSRKVGKKILANGANILVIQGHVQIFEMLRM